MVTNLNESSINVLEKQVCEHRLAMCQNINLHSSLIYIIHKEFANF